MKKTISLVLAVSILCGFIFTVENVSAFTQADFNSLTE